MLKWPDVTWHRRLSRRRRVYLGTLLVMVCVITVSALILARDSRPKADTSFVNQPSQAKPRKDTANTAQSQPAPAQKPSPPSLPLMFGVGPELDSAINHRITKEAPVKLLTSWYNGPKDLGFMSGWRTTIIPQAQASGYALHLIIYSGDEEQDLSTAYGPACGRAYPLSSQFVSDARQLAQIFSGAQLYISMFTEFQTYPCQDNTWATAESYYRALKDQYLAAMRLFHQHAPGSRVSLSWGGWQAKWDDPAKGGGRSLLRHFADVMNASDFQSFQAMATTGNRDIITDMTMLLNPYSGGVMVAHYKPDNGAQSTFEADMRDIFTDSNIATLKQNGLFAFSFMDGSNISRSETAYQRVRQVIQAYSR